MSYLCSRKIAFKDIFVPSYPINGKAFRIVAQLVAYHVRDVGVGSSSLLYPTP